MRLPNGKVLALWVPTIALVVTAIFVILYLVTNNSQRLSDLENSQNQQVITFTFNQGAARFRIVCREDNPTSNIYVCATTRIGPTPTPSRSPGG